MCVQAQRNGEIMELHRSQIFVHYSDKLVLIEIALLHVKVLSVIPRSATKKITVKIEYIEMQLFFVVGLLFYDLTEFTYSFTSVCGCSC